MTPVDGITPPKKKKINKPVKKQTKKPVKVKIEKEKTVKKIPAGKPDNETNSDKLISKDIQRSKYFMVWGIAIAIVVIIFIAWVSLMLGGKLTTNKNQAEGLNFLQDFSSELGKTWDNFREDFLKIKNSADEATTEEERIEELKESVFPDFDQYK